MKTLALFRSAARDELQPQSDIDVLVEFDGPATFTRYFDLKDESKYFSADAWTS